jgi:hypothetical protein
LEEETKQIVPEAIHYYFDYRRPDWLTDLCPIIPKSLLPQGAKGLQSKI